jgi:hypothetical protein
MLACVQGDLLPQRTCTPTPQRILLKHDLDCSPDLGWATPWLSRGLELVVCDDTLDLAQTWERQGTFGRLQHHHCSRDGYANKVKVTDNDLLVARLLVELVLDDLREVWPSSNWGRRQGSG